MIGRTIIGATALAAVLALPSYAEPISPESASRAFQLADVAPPTPRPRGAVRQEPPPPAPAPAPAYVPPPPPPPMPPPYWVGGEFIYMWRAFGNKDLSTIDGGPVALSSSQADPTHTGFRVFGGIRFDGYHSLEASYTHLFRARRSAGVINPSEDLQPYWDSRLFPDDDDWEDAFAHSATYKSSFQSIEVNLRRDMGTYFGAQTRVLVGFRYAAVHESLAFETVDSIGDHPSGYTIHTRNRMFGGQIGLGVHAPIGFVPKLGIGGEIKAAALANVARGDQHFRNDENTDILDSRNRGTRFSALFEGSLKLTYEPIQNVVIFAGYRAVAITGVATAPRQFGDPGRLNSGGTLLYHGPFAGAKIRF